MSYIFFLDVETRRKTDFQGGCPCVNECPKQKNAAIYQKEGEDVEDATAKGVASSTDPFQ